MVSPYVNVKVEALIEHLFEAITTLDPVGEGWGLTIQPKIHYTNPAISCQVVYVNSGKDFFTRPHSCTNSIGSTCANPSAL